MEDTSSNLLLNFKNLIINIGNNDGTLLSYFKKFSDNIIGMELQRKLRKFK